MEEDLFSEIDLGEDPAITSVHETIRGACSRAQRDENEKPCDERCHGDGFLEGFG